MKKIVRCVLLAFLVLCFFGTPIVALAAGSASQLCDQVLLAKLNPETTDPPAQQQALASYTDMAGTLPYKVFAKGNTMLVPTPATDKGCLEVPLKFPVHGKSLVLVDPLSTAIASAHRGSAVVTLSTYYAYYAYVSGSPDQQL